LAKEGCQKILGAMRNGTKKPEPSKHVTLLLSDSAEIDVI